MSSPAVRAASPSPRRKDDDAPSKARRSSRSDDEDDGKNRRHDSDDDYDRRDRRNRRRNRSPSPDRRDYRDRDRDRDRERERERERDRDDARRRDDEHSRSHKSQSDRDVRRSSHTSSSSARHDGPSPREDFPPRVIERQPHHDSRGAFDNRVAPNRMPQHPRPMWPMQGRMPMHMPMQGLLPHPNMIRPGMPAMVGIGPPGAMLHSGPPMLHMLQMHQQQLREQEQHRLQQRLAAAPRHASHASQGPEHALVVKQVPEYLMDTEKLTKFFKSFGRVVGISLQLPAGANVQMDSFESAAKAVESSPGLRMKLLGSKDLKILFANSEVFRTKFAAWQAAREELRAKSLLPFNWAPPHLRAPIIVQSQAQFDKIKRIVEILSKPNAKITQEKLQTTCDAVTKILKDLEKQLLLPPQGRENASDGIDVVCNRLQSRLAAVAEALSKIKPLSSTKLDLRSKSFRVLHVNKAILDQSLLESHFCNKKSLKAESVVLDVEASEALVSFFSRKDAEYAFVRGAQLNGHRLEFEWCTQASASAAEVAAPNDRDVSAGADDDEGDHDGNADGFGYSYGGEEEDEENMDDNEATIDAPAVSGCAGEEEVPMEHPDGDSL